MQGAKKESKGKKVKSKSGVINTGVTIKGMMIKARQVSCYVWETSEKEKKYIGFVECLKTVKYMNS